jgi:hypothetical protein
MTARSSAKQRLKDFFKAYGAIAIVTYLVIFATVFGGFALVIATGLSPSNTQGTLALVGASWLATKLTQPLRIGATIVLTPLIAKLLRRRATIPPE